jgi:hypothetical protein
MRGRENVNLAAEIRQRLSDHALHTGAFSNNAHILRQLRSSRRGRNAIMKKFLSRLTKDSMTSRGNEGVVICNAGVSAACGFWIRFG